MEDRHEGSRRTHDQGLRDHLVGIALDSNISRRILRTDTMRFTSTQVGVDTHVTGSSAQALSFSIRNVLLPGTGRYRQVFCV